MTGRMRKDAQRNRDLLLAAASEIMRTEGGEMPMEAICERAGLTRGTLYRNFSHRQAVYEAVLQRDLENLSQQIAASPEEPLAFIRHTTELMMVYDRFLAQLVKMSDYDATKNQARMAETLAEPLRNAQAIGALREDLTAQDILMACRMLASHWKLDDEEDFSAAFSRRFTLILRGLSAD